MKRLSNFKKQKIIDLIKEGVSINKISKLTGLGKSTIYYYYKKIKGRKNKLLNLKPSYTKKEGEIVGIFVGDGSECYEKNNYHYFVNVHFGIQNKDYLLYVKKLYETYFKKRFRIVQYKNRNIKITTYSKEICTYFKYYLNYNPKIKHSTVELKTLNLPIGFKIGFIKGLIDTDGYVKFKEKENRIRVSFHTTSKLLAYQIKGMLDEFKYKYSYYIQRKEGWKDLHSIQLWKDSIKDFLNKIKPYKLNRIKGPVAQW